MGQLIPVLCEEVVPGDFWKVGAEIVIRLNPLVAPVLHEVNVYVHYFFVPYRILWTGWEEFITGGKDGMSVLSPPLAWTGPLAGGGPQKGQLWDYFGFPILGTTYPYDSMPVAFPFNAYALIWNEYYRDEDLQNELVWINDGDNTVIARIADVLYRNWEKDYFTTARPWQQRGIAPAFPLHGQVPVAWPDDAFGSQMLPQAYASAGVDSANSYTNMLVRQESGSGSETTAINNLKGFFGKGRVDLNDAVTFDVNYVRTAFALQRWMELNARAGVRYTEFLQSMFNVSPRDERLDRPEYFGGMKAPVIFSEVLQTSQSTGQSPQGTLAGHGITVASQYCGKYAVKEFGLVMGLMSIMPRASYQQGINRQWTRRSRYEYPFPQFVNLSEQAVLNKEIYVSNSPDINEEIFGYQGRFDELRYKPNMVCGNLRDTLAYWHIGRIFNNRPNLNADFISTRSAVRKDIFAVQNVPGFIVNFGNKIRAVRPIPAIAEPGLLDHR